jgi:hypothetical protein
MQAAASFILITTLETLMVVREYSALYKPVVTLRNLGLVFRRLYLMHTECNNQLFLYHNKEGSMCGISVINYQSNYVLKDVIYSGV